MNDQDAQSVAYNYRSFGRESMIGKESFRDLVRAGTEAPNFVLPTPEGDTVELAKLRGQKHVVLEFGSIT